jgi:hypothetical protein
MPITILPPAPALPATYDVKGDEDNDFDLDSDGDVDMGEAQRVRSAKPKTSRHIVTPGELVTDDPQWMR